MSLLITGASGVGKSTIRRAIEADLGPQVEAVEFSTLVPIPALPDLAWWQKSVEIIVQHAVALQAQGKHLLFAGDPIPLGELLAAPSAPLLDGIAVCLLDILPQAQETRLAARGEAQTNWGNHIAFAQWMREHSRDPQHHPEVIRRGGWEGMQWERWENWQRGDPRWDVTVIDTTHLSPQEVAEAALNWCQSSLLKQR